MLLRVADRELEMWKSGNNPKGLIGKKVGCDTVGYAERKGIWKELSMSNNNKRDNVHIT